jgi:hypothetical protein
MLRGLIPARAHTISTSSRAVTPVVPHGKAPQRTATTLPVPGRPGFGAYPGAVFTITILGLSPEMPASDWVIEVEAMTAMYAGTVPGGFELLPGSVLKAMPQAGCAGCFAKPLKLAGALARFLAAHCAPQNVTVAPSLAALWAITNDPPPAAYANTSALLLTAAAR